MNELITPEEATMSKRKSNRKVKQMIEDCWGDGRKFYKLRDHWSKYNLRKFGSPCRCGIVSLSGKEVRGEK